MNGESANRLFVRLYLDEDVSTLIATLLRARAFEATTTLEAGQIGSTDGDQLEFAANGGMAILTHNRSDFEELSRQYVATSRQHCGIFLAVRRSPYEITRRMLKVLNRVAADEMDNRVIYI